MARKAKKDFEGAMQELEQIIMALEEGTVSLEESIKHYKLGMDLAQYCSEMLKKAEQEIYIYEEGQMKSYGEDLGDEGEA